jgi:predicted transcriptional regulator
MTNVATCLAVNIDLEMKERITRLAVSKNRSMDALMSEAMYQYVEREEHRNTLQQDALNAWQEYTNTGLHVTGSEVIEWLDTWSNDDEKVVPTCHK